MRPREIKAKLKALGVTQGDLCRAWKASKATISFLVNRKMASERLELKLAQLLGVSWAELRGKNKRA